MAHAAQVPAKLSIRYFPYHTAFNPPPLPCSPSPALPPLPTLPNPPPPPSLYAACAPARFEHSRPRGACKHDRYCHDLYHASLTFSPPSTFSQSAQRRALDMLNYVGLSDTVLKKINRRQLVDRAISYGGMLLTLIVIFIVWRWTR
ncbi:unnamed protein product [Closterium sp. NIES-53]